MASFKFNTITRADIQRSVGGNQMIAAIDYSGLNHIMVIGCPGSGKTTVTIMRAERLVNSGKTIRVFTYQNLLRTSIKNIASVNLQEHIFGFYDWWCGHRKLGYLDYFHDTAYMIDKLSNEVVIDEILIDEGQDFEARIYQTLLTKCSKMVVGADNAQKIHEKGILANNIKDILEDNNQVVTFKLEYNYRNSFEIYNFARHFMPVSERANNPLVLEMMPKGNGEKPFVFQASNEVEELSILKTLLQNAGDKNIAVLAYRQSEVNYYYDKIKEMAFVCSKYHNNSPTTENIENILVTTYKSAKGLEFQVVIMPTLETAMNASEKTAEHYYIGSTRAKENLFLIFKGANMPDCLKNFDKNAYDFVGLGGINKEKERTFTTHGDGLPF